MNIRDIISVILAKAGIQSFLIWIPFFKGMTEKNVL